MLRPRLPSVCLGAILAGCFSGSSGGRSGTPDTGAGRSPELLFCRSRAGAEDQDSEIALRTAQNLGTGRVADKSGRELHARLHPDGVHVVFARERQNQGERGRELYVSTIDGSGGEQRLTIDLHADDHPCWSRDGGQIVFRSDRGGEDRLWRMGADGRALGEFLPADPGSSDTEPDWHWPSDRIAFSRRSPGGLTRIMLVNGDGSGMLPLSRGSPSAAAGDGLGDREPAFAADGSQLLFVRRSAQGGVLMAVELATGAERALFDPQGDVCLPRWSPAMDRIFLGLSQPLQGRPGLRLASLAADGSDPLLLLPDQRYRLDGLDLLPTLPAWPAAADAVLLDTRQAEVGIEAGFRVLGDKSMLDAADGAEMVLATQTFGGHEVAGIHCRFTLPDTVDDDVLAILVEVTASTSRHDGDTLLRLTLHNPLASRQDTVTELAPPSTAPLQLGFRTQSLLHVSRERRLLVGVVGEIAHGNRAELHIDHVGVRVVPRQAAAPLRWR